MRKILITSSLVKLLLLSVVSIDYLSKSNVRERIANSLVYLKVSSANGGIRGSGTLIKIKNSTYVLTNAHVCIGPELESAIEGTMGNPTIQYEIDSKNMYSSVEYKVSELTYNLEEDWCVIPVLSEIDFPIITDKIVSNEFTNSARTMTYNRTKKTSKMSSFYACSTYPFEMQKESKESCSKNPEVQGEIGLGFASSSSNETKKLRLKEHYLYQFPTIPGDSGSPVYNKENQLVGLVSGQKKGLEDIPLYGFVTPIQSFKRKIFK